MKQRPNGSAMSSARRLEETGNDFRPRRGADKGCAHQRLRASFFRQAKNPRHFDRGVKQS
jgi:hypothetical protein